jgi:hypothetical protein
MFLRNLVINVKIRAKLGLEKQAMKGGISSNVSRKVSRLVVGFLEQGNDYTDSIRSGNSLTNCINNNCSRNSKS